MVEINPKNTRSEIITDLPPISSKTRHLRPFCAHGQKLVNHLYAHFVANVVEGLVHRLGPQQLLNYGNASFPFIK